MEDIYKIREIFLPGYNRDMQEVEPEVTEEQEALYNKHKDFDFDETFDFVEACHEANEHSHEC